MNQIGGFEEIVEAGKSSVQNVQKSAAQGVKKFASAAVGQVTGKTPNAQDPGTNEAANAAAQKQMSDDQAKQFLKDLYGTPDKDSQNDKKSLDPKKQTPPASTNPQNPLAQAVGLNPKDSNVGKSPEELAKIEALRQQLHGDYYQSLITPKDQEEETVTEKLDREKQEEEIELWEKDKKKPDPLANVKQGTGESVVGVSG
ncbi:MAG: hypothetical protein ACD_37C00350G0001 [uncultured bacterium]|nr:MAG: hypothetical protein ACD_37C00350G0001 [uncultured bacterium]